MKRMLDLVARHRSGVSCGVVSVCSSHPLVIKAALRGALAHQAPLAVIEATCNQVNQEGGYTGMTPVDFRDRVVAIAAEVGFPPERLLLGGDHLGPNPWTALPAEAAMARAEVMVKAYVTAGFRKIHADCSMSCADDPVPLPEAVMAERAVRLIAAAEAAWHQVGGEPPVYVIGTEVPVPGGAVEETGELAVTAAEAARATIAIHRRAFADRRLTAAWSRVIATVVQPGVEFDHQQVIAYVRSKAAALSRAITEEPSLVYEAHSTDYQTPAALAALVEDHFAILKVGPAATFAMREALWALDAIEQEWIGAAAASQFRAIVLKRMREEPGYWAKYYDSRDGALNIALQYSLSDRIRYYWPDHDITEAQEKMFSNLASNPPPLPLISQYMPTAFAAVRERGLSTAPADLVMAHIATVLDGYYAATISPESV